MQNAPAIGKRPDRRCSLQLSVLMIALGFVSIGCTGPDRAVPQETNHAEWRTIQTVAADPVARVATIPAPVASAATLGPHDEIQLELVGIEDTERRVTVQMDGKMSYGPVNGLRVAGKTMPAVIDLLEKELKKWYRNPRLTATLVENRSRTATILGRVNTPAVVTLRGNERVMDLISAGGGLATSRFSGSTEELADLSGAVYVRNGVHLPLDLVALVKHGNLEQNIQVAAGDYLYIPSSLSREVYVLGAVGLPQTVGYKETLTLLGAIANAEGLLEDAHPHRVLVQRRTDNQVRVATFDINKILVGKRTDVLLQPGDVIFVPGDTADHPRHIWDAFRDGTATGFGGVLGARPPAGN